MVPAAGVPGWGDGHRGRIHRGGDLLCLAGGWDDRDRTFLDLSVASAQHVGGAGAGCSGRRDDDLRGVGPDLDHGLHGAGRVEDDGRPAGGVQPDGVAFPWGAVTGGGTPDRAAPDRRLGCRAAGRGESADLPGGLVGELDAAGVGGTGGRYQHGHRVGSVDVVPGGAGRVQHGDAVAVGPGDHDTAGRPARPRTGRRCPGGGDRVAVAGVLLGSATAVPAAMTGATGAGATSVSLSRWMVSARTAAAAPMAAVNAITR